MKRLLVLGSALILLLALAVSGQAGATVKRNYYRATVSQDVYRDLLAKGTDIAAATNVAKGVQLQMVLTRSQVRAMKDQGVNVSLPRSKGQTARQAAAAQLSSGFESGATATEPTASAPGSTTSRRGTRRSRAGGHRDHRPGPRDHRSQADPGRQWHSRRHAACSSLQLHAACARVDLDRGQPPAPGLSDRAVAGERQGDQEPAPEQRALVRARREP